MFLAKTDKDHISQLFAFLLEGEQLAFDCASTQASFFTDASSKKFLLNQARQEKFHYRVFKSGVGILAPRGVRNIPGKKEFLTYRRLLTEALDRQDRAESLLGMQIIMEGLGDVAVNHISAGFDYRNIGFMCQRVRHLVLGQEDAHHQFGITRFHACLPGDNIPDYLLKRSQDYLELVNSLMHSVSELFDHFDENAVEYLEEFYADLPDWISVQRT